MDIDGVVMRGSEPIPGAAEAVRELRDAGVPYAFMSNGGGITEAKKAAQLSKILGDGTVDESQVLLSHTPMRKLAERYRGRRVVIVGGYDTIAVAESYGFDVKGGWAITCAQIAAGTKGILPRPLLTKDGLPPIDVNAAGEPPIEAVLIIYDPDDWWLELQVVSDVIAGGQPLGSGDTAADGAAQQTVEVYASNPDFLWQARYPVPRYAQGAFHACLRALWRERAGTDLRINEFGKPFASQFAAARSLVEAQVPRGRHLKRIYMIGDNPAADIRGANAAPGGIWRSVLVCTGVYRGGVDGNDAKDPAWLVEEDLPSAVRRLLESSEAHAAP